MSVSLENRDILYVEDSLTQALLLKDVLEKNKFRVTLAKDGMEGLQQLQQSLPQIIISDIEMPRMNGYDFCKHVKSDAKLKDIPVMLLTNLTDVLDVIKGIECGADSFLTKPCETHLLLSTIQNALKNKEVESPATKGKLEFFFEGEMHALDIDQAQITKLLLSTYSTAIQKNLELEEAYRNLNKAHESLEKTNETLNQLNIQKNQFLGMAAHDLRNPLTVISGFSNYLLNTPSEEINPEKSREMIKHINRSSSFMLQLINDLLDFSVIESGTLTLNEEEIDINELIEENRIFFDSLASKKNIKILYNHPSNIPKIKCDPNKIIQVLNNIVTNAIKFSHPEGKLIINLSSSPSEVIISIEDSGIGMTAEMIQNLFQPFTKLKTQGTEGERGTGLGLAIVHKIIKEHQGKITLKSEVGKGTTFYISLPLNLET